MPFGKYVRRWEPEHRNWAQWDAEHEGEGEWKHSQTQNDSNTMWSRPSSWRPNPGQDMSAQPPRVPTDDDLKGAVRVWKGDPSDLRHIEPEILAHTGVEPWNVGGPSLYEDLRAESAAVMNKVADGDPSTKMLYRGLSMPSSTIDGLKEGDSFTLPLAGFSEKAGIANMAATGARSDETNVIYKLSPGAKNYAMDAEEGKWRVYSVEKEHVTAGTFKVTGISRPGDDDYKPNNKYVTNKSPTIITLEQTAPLVKPEGGFR